MNCHLKLPKPAWISSESPSTKRWALGEVGPIFRCCMFLFRFLSCSLPPSLLFAFSFSSSFLLFSLQAEIVRWSAHPIHPKHNESFPSVRQTLARFPYTSGKDLQSLADLLTQHHTGFLHHPWTHDPSTCGFVDAAQRITPSALRSFWDLSCLKCGNNRECHSAPCPLLIGYSVRRSAEYRDFTRFGLHLQDKLITRSDEYCYQPKLCTDFLA